MEYKQTIKDINGSKYLLLNKDVYNWLTKKTEHKNHVWILDLNTDSNYPALLIRTEEEYQLSQGQKDFNQWSKELEGK